MSFQDVVLQYSSINVKLSSDEFSRCSSTVSCYNSEVCVCVCVCVCLCRFYLKTVIGNDLIPFATWRDSSSSGFKILTKFL